MPENNQEIVSSIVSSIKEWNEDDSVEQPPMMIYFLQHQYCEASLTFQQLKNVDRAAADVLAQAKKSIDFDFYLAQLRIGQLNCNQAVLWLYQGQLNGRTHPMASLRALKAVTPIPTARYKGHTPLISSPCTPHSNIAII